MQDGKYSFYPVEFPPLYNLKEKKAGGGGGGDRKRGAQKADFCSIANTVHDCFLLTRFFFLVSSVTKGNRLEEKYKRQ